MKADDPSTAGRETQPEAWVDLYADRLYSYALRMTRDAQAAEDLVQETFLAALSGRKGFEGRSSESTWLFGILKHKVLDHFRRQGRQRLAEDPAAAPEARAFHDDGTWRVHPGRWAGKPDRVLERSQFLDVFAECLRELSERLHQVFVMRELQGESTERICEVLGIRPESLWTRIHRARLLLRQCLDLNWFHPEGPRDRG